MARPDTFPAVIQSFKDNNDPAISWNGSGWTYDELYHRVDNIGKGLRALGLNPGDHISLVGENSPEIISADLAIKKAGMVTVWHSEKSSAKDLQRNIRHSDSVALIADNAQTLGKIDPKNVGIGNFFSISQTDAKNLNDISDAGKDLVMDAHNVHKDDLSTIIYTSGTTGDPKGVMLSHGNIVSNIHSVKKRVSITEDDMMLAFLPVSHTFGGIAAYTTLYSGGRMYLSTIRTLPTDMKEQHPTFIATVPAVWEKAYKRIVNAIRTKAQEKGIIAKYAVEKMIDWSTDIENRRTFDPRKLLGQKSREYLEKEVYPAIRENFGGKLRYIVSGGASLPKHIEDFFDAAGLEILVGWGLSETSPDLSGRISGRKARYSAGPLLDDVDGRVIDPNTGVVLAECIRGELKFYTPKISEGVFHVRGPNIMLGYYKNSQATDAVLKDGWLNTGDKGYFDREGNVHITGRLKDIIKLLGGQMIHPEALEDALRNSEYIDTAVVVGQEWRRLGALIVPHAENLRNYLEKRHLDYDKIMQDPNASPELMSFIKSEIYQYVNSSSDFSRTEHINKFRILNRGFSMEAGEKTHTEKVRRFMVEQTCKPLIDEMKAEDDHI